MEEELKQLLLQNLKKTQALEEKVDKIKRHIFWQQIFSVVKAVVIIVPLIFGILYAIPFFKQALSAYQSMVDGVNAIESKTGSANFLNALNIMRGNGKVSEDDIKKFLK